VFPKTLRNMWYAVLFFNPLLALLGLSILPIKTLVENQVRVPDARAPHGTT
jgi:hypothetical protein